MNPYQRLKSLYQKAEISTPYRAYNNHSRHQTVSNNSEAQFSDYQPRQLKSAILEKFSVNLEYELKAAEYKKRLQRERRKLKQIQTSICQKRKFQGILDELKQVKSYLKNQSLDKEYDLLKKQRALRLKTEQDSSKPRKYSFQQFHLPSFQPVLHYKNSFKSVNKKTNDSSSDNSQDFDQSRSRIPSSPKDPSSTVDSKRKKSSKIDSPQKPQSSNKFNKNRKSFQRYHNHEQTRKKLKRCFLAVYFLKCLQKFHLKMVNENKKFFLTYWPSQYLKAESNFKEYFYNQFSHFFRLLRQKSCSFLIPLDGDSSQLRFQKRKTIRELFHVFFSCFKDLRNLMVLGKIAWCFCRHGSFAEKGVLTANQLEIICFDAKHKYLRMDKNMQKSQIIGLIFIKIILYKILLHPWKKWPKQFDPTNDQKLISNLKLFGSILYNMLMGLQGEYLDLVDEQKYPLGNIKDFQSINRNFKIQCSSPLLYQTQKVQNQLISGLFSIQELKKHQVPLKKLWVHYDELKNTVQKIHEMSVRCNDQFKKKVNLKIEKINYVY